MDNRSIDFEFILHQLPADDPRLREAMVKTWYTFVRGIAWSLIDDPDQADYAVFETFKEGWLKLDQFRTGSDFTVWFGGIAVKVASRHLQADPPLTGVTNSTRELRARVKSLPSRLRLATVLYLLQDLSVQQIGEILGRRQKTAFGQLETGLQMLLFDEAQKTTPVDEAAGFVTMSGLLQMLLFDGAQKTAPSSGGIHDITRRALLYAESLGQASIENAESHLLECRHCQEFRGRVIRMKSLFRSSFSGGSDENEEKMSHILDLLHAAEAGGGRQKRFGKLGKEVGWIAAAILIFLVLGAVFNRINPLTEVQQAVEQQNNSRPAAEVIDGEAEVTLAIAPVVDSPTPTAPAEPGYSWDPEISADGRWIVFNSSIPDLVPGDGNQTSDIFVLNRLTGDIERVSLNSQGLEANGSSLEPEISLDGRFVVFTSWADNLAEGDDRVCPAWGIASSCPDIFLHDRRTDETELVSRNSDGAPGADFSISPRISADGNTVVFWSAAADLTGDDYRDCQGISGSPRQTSCLDLFIYNRPEDAIRRLPIGRDPLSHFERPYDESLSISGDGRWLVTAIQSRDRIANSLGIANSPDLYLFNLETLEPVLLNAAADGTPGDAPSYHANLSRDGKYVAFSSRASNLVQGDNNNRIDVFLLDRDTGGVLRLSTRPDGSESSGHSGVIEPDSGWMGNGLAISGDGNWVVFASTSRDLVSEPKDFCAFAQACQNLFLTHRTGGETRQLNLTNLDFQPFLSVTEFGEYTLFMAVSPSCSQGDYCVEIYLHDRLGAESTLVGGTEATTGLLVPQSGLHTDSHNLWLHSNWVSSVLFSPDGRTVTSGSLDGSIKLTSIEDETVVGTIVGDGQGISALAYSPAGDQLAAVNKDGDVSIWKLPEGSLTSVLRDFPGVKDAVFSPDGDSLALGGEGGVWIWDMQDGLVEDRLEVERGDIGAVRYSPDGRLLAAANKDHTIWIWDLSREGPAYRLGGHTERVNELKFSHDGSLLASASNDGSLNIWQVSKTEGSGLRIKLLYTLTHGEWVSSFDFSPDGRHLATGTFGSQVVIWDLEDPRLVGIFFEQTQNQVMSVAFSPDGSDLAAGTVQGEVHYWQNLTYDSE